MSDPWFWSEVQSSGLESMVALRAQYKQAIVQGAISTGNMSLAAAIRSANEHVDDLISDDLAFAKTIIDARKKVDEERGTV